MFLDVNQQQTDKCYCPGLADIAVIIGYIFQDDVAKWSDRCVTNGDSLGAKIHLQGCQVVKV